jgi:hypothetical protein
MSRLPRVYGGASFGLWLSNDTQSRGKPFSEPDGDTWVVEAGGAPLRRIGVAVERDRTRTVAGRTDTITFRTSGTQTERMALGLVRGRVAWSKDVAVDAIGGAGILYQRYEARETVCLVGFRPCVDTRNETLNRRSPAFMIGGETPFRVAPHVFVVPHVRVYFLRRGEHHSSAIERVPWQLEWSSSTRGMIGLSGQVGW